MRLIWTVPRKLHLYKFLAFNTWFNSGKMNVGFEARAVTIAMNVGFEANIIIIVMSVSMIKVVTITINVSFEANRVTIAMNVNFKASMVTIAMSVLRPIRS